MRAETVERLASFEKHAASIEEMSNVLGPLAKRYLLLSMNIRLCGGSWDEQIVLNLRKDDWPKQYKFCQEKFGNRILGMEINWCD